MQPRAGLHGRPARLPAGAGVHPAALPARPPWPSTRGRPGKAPETPKGGRGPPRQAAYPAQGQSQAQGAPEGQGKDPAPRPSTETPAGPTREELEVPSPCCR